MIGSKINLTEDSDRKYNQIILEMIDKFGDEKHDFGKIKNDKSENNNDYPFIEDYYVE